VRVALGTRNGSLGQRFRQKRLHDEFPLSRDTASDAASTGRSFRPAARTKYRCLVYKSDYYYERINWFA
jgi:hypothetical protein